MPSSNSSASDIYDALSRNIRVFVGGFLEAMFVYTFADFTLSHVSLVRVLERDTFILNDLLHPEPLLTFSFLLAVAIGLPIILSFTLSKREPSLKIVPPFYMCVIAAFVVVFTFLAQSKINFENGPYLLLGAMFLPVIGSAEDRAATYFVGREGDESFIYYEYRLVYHSIEEVKARLSLKEVKFALFLGACEGTAENGYYFKTRTIANLFAPTNITKIKLSKNKDTPEFTDLKVVYYELGKYNLRNSQRLTQEAFKGSGYLTNLLRRTEPPMDFAVITDFVKATKLSEPEPLVMSVINEMQGFYSRNRQLSRWDWLRFGAFTILLLLAPVLFILEQTTIGIVAAAFDVLIVLVSLPDLKRLRSEE